MSGLSRVSKASLVAIVLSTVLIVPTRVANAALSCTTAGAINGTSGDDVLTGTSGDNVICGHGGNDTIRGQGGSDTIYGGAGNDTVYAGTGNDWVAGGDGADRLLGEAGIDTIYGDAGSDVVYGGTDGDTIRAGLGNDTVKGEDGNDKIYGDDGTDTLYGDGHADTIVGGNHDDTLKGGPGNDALRGEGGNDSLDGEADIDDVRGGTDFDTCRGGAGFTDSITDFDCERRASAERMLPIWNSADTTCGVNDTSCLAFAGFSGQGVLGYTTCNGHNCVAYAAYRLYKRGMRTNAPRGNAYQWDNSLGALSVVSSSSPAVGDIAQWESKGSTSSNNCGGVNCGHVAYVERVNYASDGTISSITISESAWCTRGAVRSISRTSAEWPTRFLRWNRTS